MDMKAYKFLANEVQSGVVQAGIEVLPNSPFQPGSFENCHIQILKAFCLYRLGEGGWR